MTVLKYRYWQDESMWLGYLEEYPDYMTQGETYLEEYPDYMTQGETLEDLQENLRDIYQEMTSGAIPSVRRVGELAVARKGANSSPGYNKWTAS